MLSISDDKGFVFDVDADYAVISKDGREVARFCLAPVSGNNKTTLGPWREVDKYHLAADVHGLEATAHLRIDHGYACYHLESSIGHFERLYYLTAGCIDGDGWQSYLSDVNDCFRSYDLDNQVPISSCFDGLSPDEEDGAGMCDPGDNPPTWIWNVPVRVAALNSWAGWIGLSLPGPLPVGVTRMSVKDRKFDLLFEQCQPSCRQGAMPRVYFLTGLEGNYDALPAHRDLSFALGWMVKHSAKSPEWWSSPTYKISIDLCSKQVDDRGVHKVDAFSVDEKGRKRSFLTTEFVREHVRAWRQQCRLDTDPVRMHLDQNYFYGYGSRRVLKELGGVDGLRQFTDQLRSQGVYIGPYYNPFLMGMEEPFYKEHPECFCKAKHADIAVRWCNPELRPARLDWTHPLTREYQMEYLEFLLSDKSGCLNADWLAHNNSIGPDPRFYEFHDPDWGTGDLLVYKVHKMVYKKVKQIKPEAMVRRIAGLACYIQPYVDQVQLIEHWPSETDDYYKRGQIFTRTMSDVLINTDHYYCSQTKGLEFFMGMLAWNIPEYGGLTKAIHPYGHYRDLPLKDQLRRTAGVQVYMNAPQSRSDLFRVSCDHDRPTEQWRKRTQGPLAGWYASLAVSPRCFVTYSEHCARIGSSESRTATIPLPPKAKVLEVKRLLHAGGEVDHPYQLCRTDNGAAVRLKVLDCGYETLYTEIRYDLKGTARGGKCE